MRHQFTGHPGSWHCSVCQWTWPTRRQSECPGIPRYSIDRLPPFMQTLPQLARMKLQPSGPPDCCYYRRLPPYWLPYYDIRKARHLDSMPWFQITERLRSKKSCQWCGCEIGQDDNHHTHPRHLCLSCRFEQVWLRQCKRIQLWAQERLRAEEAVILDTETIGSLANLHLVELAIIDMQGHELVDTRLRHQRPAAAPERQPLSWPQTRKPTPPPDLPGIWPQVSALFERCRTVIAYNASFHREALSQSAQRLGLFLPPLEWECLMTNYAVYYGRVYLNEHGRFDERDPFQWQSRRSACEQQNIPCGPSERAKQHAIRDLAILRALAAGAQQWQG